MRPAGLVSAARAIREHLTGRLLPLRGLREKRGESQVALGMEGLEREGHGKRGS